MSQVLTDFWFRCASEQWATSALKQSKPAYFYRYEHILSDGSVFPRFGLPDICSNVVSRRVDVHTRRIVTVLCSHALSRARSYHRFNLYSLL